MAEQLVAASSVCDGKTACVHHARSVGQRPVPAASEETAGVCQWCRRVPHRAYFLVDQVPLCIRHAADAVFPADDMRAHNMAHAAYLRLKVEGVHDAY